MGFETKTMTERDDHAGHDEEIWVRKPPSMTEQEFAWVCDTNWREVGTAHMFP